MILSTLYTFIATFCFSILFNIRGKNLLFASIGGGVTWFIYLLASSYFHISNLFSFFLASIFASTYSEIMARVLKTPVTTFIISAIVPLVPGGRMYYTMFESIQGNVNASLSLGFETISIAGIIAVSVFLVSSASKTLMLSRIKLKEIYKDFKAK